MLDPKLVPILKELYPLRNLSDDELTQVAAEVSLVALAKGEVLKVMGDKETPCFFLLNGQISYVELSGGETRSKPVVVRVGDFFGADQILFAINRNFEVTAAEPAQLVSLSTPRLVDLLSKIAGLKTGLQEGLELRRTLQSKAFAWLQETEQIKQMAIKHPAVLVEFLFWPVIYLLGGLLLLGLGWQITIASWRIAFISFGVGVTVFGIGACIWQYIDWGNDYYIITDQRVVWLEQIFGLYEGRREALLTAIKSTEVKTSQLGRILGYGDLTVFALMGQVPIQHVANPHQIKAVIDRMQKVASLRLQQEDTRSMERMIRRKIEPPPPPAGAAPARPGEARKGALHLPELGEYFNLAERLVKDESITYRKHRLILLLKTAPPLLLMSLLLAATIWLVYENMTGVRTFPTPLTTLLSALFLASGLSFWLWYEYMDWHDDIYVITNDKIIDSVKHPLGTEVTKSAPLGSIQNMDYERLGLVGLILNMGNVTVNTGSESKMVFMQVHDPANMQMDIFNRLYSLKRKQQAAESSRQWEQMSDWFAAYHRQSEDIRSKKKE